MTHNPLAVLSAAMQTNRPELLKMFKGQMDAMLTEEHSLDAETARALVTVIEALSTEVYDLRRTVKAMEECNKHIHQALNGCQKHLKISREVAVRGQAGNLPEHYDAPSIIADIKAGLVDEPDED
jgi:hypothetical protein